MRRRGFFGLLVFDGCLVMPLLFLSIPMCLVFYFKFNLRFEVVFSVLGLFNGNISY